MKRVRTIGAVVALFLCGAAVAASVPEHSVGVYRDDQGVIHAQELPSGDSYFVVGANSSGVAYYSTDFNTATTEIGASDRSTGIAFDEVVLTVEYRVDPNQIAEIRIKYPPPKRVAPDSQKRIAPGRQLVANELNLVSRKNASDIAAGIADGDRARLAPILQGLSQELQRRLNGSSPPAFVIRNIELKEGGFTVLVENDSPTEIPTELRAEQILTIPQSDNTGWGWSRNLAIVFVIGLGLGAVLIVKSMVTGSDVSPRPRPPPIPRSDQPPRPTSSYFDGPYRGPQGNSNSSARESQVEALRTRINAPKDSPNGEGNEVKKNKRKLAIDD